MKMLFNEILNIFKVLFVQLTRLLSFIIGKDTKDTKQVNKATKAEVKKEETKTTKEVVPVSNTTTSLPDTSDVKSNPDLDIKTPDRLFSDEKIQEVINKYLKDEYEIEVEKIEDKELLEELDKFNKKVHEKINAEIDTGWEIVNEDDLKKKVEFHVEEYFDEKKRLFEKPEVIEKRKEQEKEKEKEQTKQFETPIKEENKTNNYKVVTPIKKRLKTENKEQQIKKEEPIVTIPKEKKEELKEDIKEKEEKTFMVPTKEEKPTLTLKDEVINVVAASTVILASIAKEIIEAPTDTKEELKKEEIENIEVKKEKIKKEIETIEKEIEKEIIEEKKEVLKESLEKLKEKEEKVKETEIIQKEAEQIYVDIKPLEIETLSVVQDAKKEKDKEEFEDKNYEALSSEIDQTIEKIENFLLLNEKNLTDKQKLQLKNEMNNLESIKNNIEKQKAADIRVEEHKLDESILQSELNGLKERLNEMKYEEKIELQEQGLQKYEDLEKKTLAQSKDIEKKLLKKKVKKASRAAAISSLFAIPFVHNPYFLMFTTGVFVKASLLGMHSTLAHKEITSEVDLNGIQKGRDALERSLDQLVDNINHLDYVAQRSLSKHPELAKDKEYMSHISTLRDRMTKNYDKLIRKQHTIDKHLYKTKKNVKVLKKDLEKDKRRQVQSQEQNK